MHRRRRFGLAIAGSIVAAAFAAGGCEQILGLDSLQTQGPDARADGRSATDSGSGTDSDSGSNRDGGSGDSAYAQADSMYARTVLADKPLAYWPLDETTGEVAHDAIDNARHEGRLSDAGVTLNVPGAVGTAMKFDGTGCIDILHGTDFQFAATAAFTIELWVNVSTFGEALTAGEVPFVVGTLTGTTGRDYGWSVSLAPTPDAGGLADIWGWNATDASAPIVMSASSNACGDGGSGMIPLNTWTYVVGTYDGQQKAQLFVNGEPCTPSVENGPPALLDRGSLTFGCSTAGHPYGASYGVLSGALDEVAVYDAVLQPARILSHYGAR